MSAFSSALPIDRVLGKILQALEEQQNAVLVAEPGAGKTTRVPLALLDAKFAQGQKILVLEPRRLAAKSAARRMAQTLGQSVGEQVGYRVRMDSRVGPNTRIEVMTEGVFTRLIQEDPELTNVAAVLFDEFHERSLEGDLGLALALDVQGALREDLRLMPMSATMDGAHVQALLGDATLIHCEGRQFPVETHYRGRDGSKSFEGEVAKVVREAMQAHAGSALVFLPGQREIHAVERQLGTSLGPLVDVLPLYGALDGKAQDEAIRPARDGRRKVVLTTSIAQTSLTIDGVTLVIDCGLARVPKYDPASGLTRLETLRVSQASADQRRGRAGRTAPGHCYRLWEQAQTGAMPKADTPEILESDLSNLVLALANWGVHSPDDLRFPSPPPKAAWAEACSLLQELDALDKDGNLTSHGKKLAKLPLSPRLAHMLLLAAKEDEHPLAALMAVVASEPNLGGKSADIRKRLQGLLRADGSREKEALAQARRWQKMVSSAKGNRPNLEMAGELLSLAYPDRIGQQRGATGRFRLANGRGAALDDKDALAREAFIVAAEVTGKAAHARIMLCAPLASADLLERHGAHVITRTQVNLGADGVAKAVEQRCLGALVLEEKRINAPDPELITDAVCNALQKKGARRLPWSKEQGLQRARLQYLRAQQGTAWPDVSDEALSADFSWLRPFLAGLSSPEQLDAAIMGNALSALVPYELQAEMERLAPSHYTAPTGTKAAIDYGGAVGPTVRLRVQELFGLGVHPSVLGGQLPLVLELLSPAQRPIQITQDLPGFWRGSWQDVKADMRGRYPRHHWPDDPLDAEATRRAKPRK
ncbi:ATP-dependent helicase HrpB [Polycladidibacter hongkongensis]|uniref:ATP-dependent helicase HrpB n=1 Tax=Polycladidibacter hongkongensis TaxID=1647556 RepID=UPI00082C8C1A|nr:ATP-dependent helicase HrpB [Pseudovibrio hongkongensis]